MESPGLSIWLALSLRQPRQSNGYGLLGIVAGLQIISPLTRFCPVYFALNKLMPDTEPIQDGSRKKIKDNYRKESHDIHEQD